MFFTVNDPDATDTTVYPASLIHIVFPISSTVKPGPVFTFTILVPATVVHLPAREAGWTAISVGLGYLLGCTEVHDE